ncbi:MAG: hypothetical protein ACT4TC_05245 [Myxococcaceae bacterium]
MSDSTFGEPDLRTLRLATPVLDSQRLEQFIRYQRCFLERVREPALNAVARAHQLALEDSALAPRELARITPVVAAFAGKRWTLARLSARRTELASHAERGDALKPRQQDALRRLPQELLKASELTALVQRYGQPLVDLLMSREAELVELHEKVSEIQRNPR